MKTPRGARWAGLAAASLVAVVAFQLAGCGGGGSGARVSPPPPPPQTLTITTNTLPSGTVNQAYNTTVQASGGTGARSWSATGLPALLTINTSTGAITGTPQAAGTFSVNVQVTDSGSPQQTATRQFSLTINPTAGLTITTTSLPSGTVGQAYNTTVQASGGSAPLSWSATGLPSGLNIGASTGTISGTPGASGTFTVNVQVQDSSSPQQTASRQFSLTINAAPGGCGAAAPSGRNDTVATATTLTTGGNCTLTASISPFSDPSSSGPDQDFYRLTATANSTVVVETFARRLNPMSFLDSVLLIVDSNGQPFTTCKDPGDDNPPAHLLVANGGPLTPDATPTAFDDTCINDDISLGNVRDSRLEFRVPGSGTVTFFVRVLDWRGDARPDFRYNLTITGAN